MSVSTCTEIPVFKDDRPLWHHFNLRAGVATAAGPTLLRHCEISIPPQVSYAMASLRQLLDVIDDQFAYLESEFGVHAVPHSWGFYPRQAVTRHDGRLQSYLNPPHTHADQIRKGYHLLPPDMLLAAEVVIIDQLQHNPVASVSTETALAQYRQTAYGLFLSDLQTSQNVFGQPRPNGITTSPGDYIVDIEPRLSYA